MNVEKKNKTKRERFITIVESRVTKVLNDLDSLGKCSNKKNYEYSEKDVKKIFNALDKKIKDTKSMFQESNNQNQKNQFTLE